MKRPNIVDMKKGPERIIQDALIKYLEDRSWFVKETHGNVYQSGFPDLYCHHKRYGQRWIEVKNPEAYAFTPAQLETFPKMCLAGAHIWILTAATDHQYQKLFKPYNWYTFLSVMK